MINLLLNIRHKESETTAVRILLVLVFFIFLSFGFYHLTKFVTADEHYWVYERIPQYWKSIENKNLKKTLINDKPGVTIALISGLSLLFEKNPEKHVSRIDEDLKRYNIKETKFLYFSYRAPLLVFNAIFLFLFFWIIKKITNSWIALWSVTFIGLSPILIGISQIINPDSFLWLFFVGAIFAYSALLKYKKFIYIIATSILTGLAILSKYTANILIPFYLLLMISYYIIEIKNLSIKVAYKYFKSNLFFFFCIIIGTLIIISIFLPAIFIKPIYLYRLTIDFAKTKMLLWGTLCILLFIISDTFIIKNFFLINLKKILSKNRFIVKTPVVLLIIIYLILIIGRNIYSDWRLFQSIPFDLKKLSYAHNFNYFPNFLEKLLLESNTFIFSITPITLFLSFYIWFKLITKKSIRFNFYIISYSSFIVFYIIASIKANVLNTIRYNIVLYPIISFLAAIGLYEFIKIFSKKLHIYILASITIIIFSLISLFLVKPYYFNYTNLFLPKDKIITDAWGYGGYEAAQYLNNLENSDELVVWSDYYGICEYFKGKCITNYTIDLKKYPIDYYIITRRGKIRYGGHDNEINSVKAGQYYFKDNPIWRLNINNREKNYIKIFKAN